MRVLRTALGCALWFSVPVAADTIAQFDDPASGSDTPLFTFDADAGLLSGAWSLPGLTLETVGGDFDDATFTMEPVSVDAFGGVGAGQIDFFASGDPDNPIFIIEFDSGQLTPTNFGATEFLATNDVVFSGSILPLPTKQESFSFALANHEPFGLNGFTATAAFTSSAEFIPEPGAVFFLIPAGAYLTLRRRHVARCLTQRAG